MAACTGGLPSSLFTTAFPFTFPLSRGVFALCLAWGAGCPKDVARATQLAQSSAAAGSKFGHYALGRLLFDSPGGDDGNACRVAGLFRQAAALNLDAGQWGVGFLHEHGVGVARNVREALHWYQLAAEQGMPWACASVAQMYALSRSPN